MTRRAAVRKSCATSDLCASRYRRRKARKLRTWTFPAEALFARETREGRRGTCYAEVAKHASSARKVFPGAGISRPGCVPGGCTRRKRLRCAEENRG